MKKLVKILLWTGLIVIVLLVAAGVAISLFFPKEDVRRIARERAGNALGRAVEVSDIDVSFWGGLGIKLEDVSISNPDGTDGNFLEASSVDLKLSLWPLLSREVRVDRFIVEQPRILLHKDSAGAINYAFESADTTVADSSLEQMSPEAKAAAAAISFEALEIEDGYLVYQDDSTGVRFTAVDMDLTTSLKNPLPDHYNSSGELKIESLTVVLDEPLQSVSVSLDYEVYYDYSRDHLEVQKADLSVNELEFALSTQADSLLSNPSVRVNVKSDRVSVAALLSLLPPKQREELADFKLDGDFSFDVDLEYNIPGADELLSYAGTAVISGMTMSKEGLDGELRLARAMLDFKPDNVRMNIENGTFDGRPISGQVVVDDFDDPFVNAELGGTVNLAFIQPFLPSESEHELGGQAEFDIRLSGRTSVPASLDYSGDLKVTEGKYNSLLMPVPVTRLELDSYFDNKLLNVRRLEAEFGSGKLSFAGRIEDLVPLVMADSAEAQGISPAFDGTMTTDIDLQMLEGFLPEKGSPSLTGRFISDLALRGEASNLAGVQVSGTVAIRGAAYTDSLLPEPIESFEAEMVLTPDTITVNSIAVRFTTTDVAFSGQLVHPFPYLLPVDEAVRAGARKPHFSFSLSSHRFDTDRLFPEAVPGAAQQEGPPQLDSVSIVILPDINGAGTITIDTLIYAGVEFTSIVGRVRIKDRRIECYDVSGSVYSGSMSGKTTVDLSDFENPVYDGSFSAEQIQVNDLATQFTPVKNMLYGVSNFTGSYTAHGWEPDQFLKSIDMSGDLAGREGRFVTPEGISNTLEKLPGNFRQRLSGEQHLKDLNTGVIVRDGRLYTDKLKSEVADVGDLEIEGSYGLLDSTLDYRVNLLLTEAMSAEVAKSVAGSAGLLTGGDPVRLTLPLVISGTSSRPNVRVDFDAIAKQVADLAGKQLKDKAGDLLKGLFKKKP
ncbi:MAG: AsmA family protein [Candidatus Zixiibacteriota bacterium]|nr:MAG: AsmA family protein [candidate division Zixibacteria bacterium]